MTYDHFFPLSSQLGLLSALPSYLGTFLAQNPESASSKNLQITIVKIGPLPYHSGKCTGCGVRGQTGSALGDAKLDRKTEPTDIGGTMHVNKWTVGLATVGLVSLGSV